MSLPSIKDNSTYLISKLRNRYEIVKSCHQLQSKRHKKVHDYSQKSIDNFTLIFFNASPKLTDQEKRSIATYFGYSSKDQNNESNTKRILTHVLKRWNEKKSSAHPSTCTLTSAEFVALKAYSIELK